MHLPVYQILRFCVVGLGGMIIDFSVTWTLREKTRWNSFLASSTGFLLAASSNFVWNKYWTFHNESRAYLQQYSLFMLISLAGLAINNAVLWICYKRLRMPFYFSKAVAVAVVVVWNYILNKTVAFR